MQLQVHVRESFLHVLNMRRGIIEMTLPQPQIATQSRNLTIWVKAGSKQPTGMESLNPLCVIHIGFASRHRTGITRIGEYDLKAVRFQYFVNRNPVNAC